MDAKVEEAKKSAMEWFILKGGGTVHLKWFKALLDDLVEAARISVWEDIKACPECCADTKLVRECECGWSEESP
jgi:hypothetical protein